MGERRRRLIEIGKTVTTAVEADARPRLRQSAEAALMKMGKATAVEAGIAAKVEVACGGGVGMGRGGHRRSILGIGEPAQHKPRKKKKSIEREGKR